MHEIFYIYVHFNNEDDHRQASMCVCVMLSAVLTRCYDIKTLI